MGISVDSGPSVVTGFQNPQQNDNPEAGPSVAFGGNGLLDPRYVLSIGQAPNYGKVFSLYSNPQTTLIDGFPQAPSASGIASIAGSTSIAQAAAGGTAVPLQNTNATLGFSVNVPLVPWVTTRNATNPTTDGKVAGYGLSATTQGYAPANVVTALALDFGQTIFTLPAAATVTPTALTNNATSPNAVLPQTQSGQSFPANQILTVLAQSATNWGNPLKFYIPGQYVIIPGAGNAGGTSCLIAQIVALDFVQNFMVINTPVLNTSSNGTGVGVGPADPNGIAYWPFQRLGAIASMDPACMVSRTLSVVSSNAADTAILFTIQGYDSWLVPMTEQITSNGTTPVLGKKAFKFIQSITASHSGAFSTTGTVTVGTAATNTGSFGFPVRMDQFEYLSLFVNGAYVTANTGFTGALAFTTNPATYTTNDVRGTYTMQTAPSGAVHLALYANIPSYQAANATLLNATQLFGTQQT